MIVTLSLRPKKSEWAVYWYLCGSDLESKHGAASADLEEMFQIQPPKGVKVVVQTGGAKGWKREEIPSDRIGRFIYDKKGWKKKETLELQSMGDPGTLVDFLRFCDKNYPAEKTMLILWNHGGGTLGGVSYDENYGMDSFSLAELRDAFAQTGKSYDIIGFDACLMANLETANSVSPYGTYLIASQELEPANGWNYTGIIEALQHDPEIMPEDLGRAVCDSFMQGCIRNRSDREATLSLIDLSKIPELSEQYQQYGKELFAHALKEETFLASYARKVEQVERIGYVIVPDEVTESKTVYAAIAGAGRALGYVCAPSMFQKVIASCVGNTGDIELYKKNRDLLYDGLTKIGYECFKPQGAFYMFVKALEPDADAFCERAKDQDLLIVSATGFGCPGYARVSYCVDYDMIERSFSAFEKLYQSYRKEI